MTRRGENRPWRTWLVIVLGGVAWSTVRGEETLRLPPPPLVARPSAAPVASPSGEFLRQNYEPTLDRWEPAAQPGAQAAPLLAAPQPPPQNKSVLQKIGLLGDWISGTGGDDFALTEWEAWVVLAVPCPTEAMPLIFTPAFGEHFLAGPDAPDLPARVYDAYLEVRWIGQLSPRWTLDLSVTPGWYSDFESNNSDALRITGRAMVINPWTDTFKLVWGATWLDRDDVPALPVCGVIWNPSDEWKMDLVFPKPKAAYRWGVDAAGESWGYIRGEFGGGTWAILRADGSDDVASYRDWRVLLGLERKWLGGPATKLEVGYVFNRHVEYESATPEVEPDGAFIVRGEATF